MVAYPPPGQRTSVVTKRRRRLGRRRTRSRASAGHRRSCDYGLCGLPRGSLEAAERHLALAERGLEGVFGSASVGRRGQALVLLGVVRLLLAGQRGNLLAGAEEAQRLQILAEALAVHHIRAQLELPHGRDADALAAFWAAERLAGHLAAPSALATPMQALLLLALVRLGETERAEQVVDGLGEEERDRGEIGVATAMLRLAQDDPHAATVALAPVLDES